MPAAAKPQNVKSKLLVRHLPESTVVVLSTVRRCAIDVAAGIEGQRAGCWELQIAVEAAKPEVREISTRRPHHYLAPSRAVAIRVVKIVPDAHVHVACRVYCRPREVVPAP